VLPAEGLWNYFTEKRANPDSFYEEGENYPKIEIVKRHTTYPAVDTSQIDGFGSNYVSFIPQPTSEKLHILFRGLTNVSWGVTVLEYQAPSQYTVNTLPVESNGQALLSDLYWLTNTDVVLIPCVLSNTGPNQTYAYEASFDSLSMNTFSSRLEQNFPNPLKISEQDQARTYFPFDLSIDAKVTITIHSLTGERVRKLDLGTQSGSFLDTGRLDEIGSYWDGRNEDGKLVASGIYLYTLKAGTFVETRKLALIR